MVIDVGTWVSQMCRPAVIGDQFETHAQSLRDIRTDCTDTTPTPRRRLSQVIDMTTVPCPSLIDFLCPFAFKSVEKWQRWSNSTYTARWERTVSRSWMAVGLHYGTLLSPERPEEQPPILTNLSIRNITHD